MVVMTSSVVLVGVPLPVFSTTVPFPFEESMKCLEFVELVTVDVQCSTCR